MSLYSKIVKKSNYDRLLASGLFFEFFPELTGDWDFDKFYIEHHQNLVDIKKRINSEENNSKVNYMENISIVE